MNTKIINYSNIAQDTGTDHKTVQKYFQILEETFIGFFLPSHARSVRKVQRKSPKFYFFDLGVKRSSKNALNIPLMEGTSEFGEAFESFVINEIYRLNAYLEKDYQLSYLRTKDDVEIDLLVERPGLKTALIEIKSSEKIDERHIRSLLHFKSEFPNSEMFCLSRVPRPQKIQGVHVLPWDQGIKELGL